MEQFGSQNCNPFIFSVQEVWNSWVHTLQSFRIFLGLEDQALQFYQQCISYMITRPIHAFILLILTVHNTI